MTTVRLSNGKQFEAPAGQSILDAAAQAGLVLEHSCRSGRCGTCKAHVGAGASVAIGSETSLTPAEIEAGWILTCTRGASSDLQLDLEDLGPLAAIPVRLLPCRIAALEKLGSDVLRLRLRLPPGSNFRYLAGQYLNLIARDGVRRSYSIANPPAVVDGTLELQVRRVDGGAMSAYLFEQAQLNDLLRLEGPRGTFFLRALADLDLVFLATGTGIAPILAMLGDLAARDAAAQPRSVSLYWGGRRSQDLYLNPAPASMPLRYVPVLSRAGADWTGARGYVQQALLESKPDWSRTVVYACGSDLMITSARSQLAAAGLGPDRFHSDAFVSSS